MNKKELRKELELTLVKTIEEVLNKRNHEAAKKIREITYGASKIIAKKFYKSLKAKDKTVKSAPSPARKPVPKAKPAVKAKAPVKTKKVTSKK